MAKVIGRPTGLNDLLAASKKVQMDDQVYLWRPDVNPLITLLTNIKRKKKVQDMEWKWMTQKTKPPYIPLAANYVAGDGHFHVAAGEGAWFHANDLVWLENGVQYIVTLITEGGTDQIDVTMFPGAPDQTDANVAAPGKIIMGPAIYGDLADAPDSNSIPEESHTNHLSQIMKSSLISDLATKVARYGPDYRNRKLKEALMAWKADAEAHVIMGIDNVDTSNSTDPDIGTLYCGDGINVQIGTTRDLDLTAYGAFDYDAFTAWLQDTATEYASPSDLVMFAPPSLFSAIEADSDLKAQIQRDPDDKRFGYEINKLVTSGINLPLVKCRALSYLAEPTALVVDINDVQLVGFEGIAGDNGDPKLYTNVQTGIQVNKVWDFYRGIIGVQVNTPCHHSRVINWV